MKEFKTQAYIHSLDDALGEVTVIAKHKMFGHVIPNSYIVKYKDTLCTAIFNCFNGAYYVDDIYGVVTEYEV